MDPSEWLKTFREMHTLTAAGKLPDKDKPSYFRMREELARSLNTMQGLTVADGQSHRRHFRVAHAYKVEVNVVNTTLTRDISRSGFACLVTQVFQKGQSVPFQLFLGGGQAPISGQCTTVTCFKQSGNSKASFEFGKMADDDAERLEVALFSAVLSRMPK
jgi:PilZ domain